MSLPTADLRPVIEASAALAKLPAWDIGGELVPAGEWLEGLVLTESSGNPKAVRYEPAHDRAGRADAADDPDTPGKDDGLLEDDRSYGLMQVMGFNLRALCGVAPGTAMNFGFALDPLTNLALGLRLLVAELRVTGGDVARALARFNGGPTGERRDVTGRMRCQEYVDRVTLNAIRARVDRKLAARAEARS